MSVPATSSRTSSALPTLVQPPLDARHAPIAHVVGDLVEEDIRAVDRAVDAAHALIFDGCLNGCAGGGVVEGNAPAAVWVAVGERAHKLVWQSDGEVVVGIDVGAARAEAAVPVCHVADAGTASALAGAGSRPGGRCAGCGRRCDCCGGGAEAQVDDAAGVVTTASARPPAAAAADVAEGSEELSSRSRGGILELPRKWSLARGS